MKKQCQQCNKEYDCRPARAHISKFCSVRCRCDWEQINGRITLSDEDRKSRKTEPTIEYLCEGCGKQFVASKWKNRKYCTRKCGASYIGKQPTHSWREGRLSTDPKIIAANNQQSKTMSKLANEGKLNIWNKGLTKDTDERVAKYVKSQTEWRNTDSPAKDEWKNAMSKGQVHAWSQGKYPDKFTKPELIVWEYLKSLGYCVKPYSDKSDDDPTNVWYHQYPFFDTFVPDFASPDLKSIIEVDGCAYHAHDPDKCANLTAKYGWPKFAQDNAKKDRKKHWLYHDKGWKWANVWGCEAVNSDFHRLHHHLPLDSPSSP